MAALLAAALLGSVTGCSKSRKRHLLTQAERDFQAQQYDKAEVEYRGVLQTPPPSAIAIRQLGLLYFEEGRMGEAFRYLSRAAQLEPTNSDVQVKLALTYLGGGKPKEARTAAMSALAAKPGDETALEVLAETAATAQDVAQVQQTVEKLRASDSDKAGYHLASGILDFRQKKLAESETELRRAIALDPKCSSAYEMLAGLHLGRNETKQAEEALKTAAELSPWRSNLRIRYADFQIQTGATNEARKAMEEITSQAPDYIPGWLALMKLAAAQRRTQDCADIVKTILNRDRANFDALMEDGSLSLVKGDGPAAIAKFERLSDMYKTSPRVPFELAAAYLSTGNKSKAIASLNQALSLDPRYTPAIFLLAELDMRQNKSAEAVALLQPLVKAQPQLVKAKMLLATAYMSAQKPDQALTIYRQLAETYPKDPQLPLLMGIVLEMQNDPSGARQAFEKALELAPNYLQALEKLTDLDVFEKHYEPALARIDQLIDKFPKSAVPWMLKADVYLAQRDSNQAEKALLKAIDLNPDFSEAYVQLTRVYVGSQKYQQALDRLNGLVAKTNDVTAWLQIAEIHDQLKQSDLARDAYEKALQFSSNSSVALNNLAYLYCEHYGDFDKALKLAERAKELAPYSPNASDTLGWILFKKGQYPRALTTLEDAAEGQPANPAIQFHLGMAHYMMDEEAPARVAFQQVLATKKDIAEKEEARRRLAVLDIDTAKGGAAVQAQLEKILHDDPADSIALSRLAALQEQSGHPEQAAGTYQTVLRANPKNAQVTLKLAELNAGALGNAQKALELAKSAHTLAPDDPRVSQVLGSLVFQSGDRAWALSLLQEAARGIPDSPDLLHDLAWAYYSAGNVSQAETTMRQAAELPAPFGKQADAQTFLTMIAASKSPAEARSAASRAQQLLQTNANYVPALMVSALAQEQQANYPQAQEFCDKALAVYPEFVPAIRLSGILACRLNDYAKSEEFLRRSVQKSGGDEEANYYLGMDYLHLQRTNDGKLAFQRAVSINPSGKFAAEAKVALAKLK